jgi:PTS system galactitol-specific IIB component
MKDVRILSVCGSGTVTSAMVSRKLSDALEKRGYHATCFECKPQEAASNATMGHYDVIVYTSPLPEGDYPCPTVSSFPCISGMGEEEFFDEVANVLKASGK